MKVPAPSPPARLLRPDYSKADWHSHSFWDPSITFPSDRNTNYDIATNASKWADFVAFDKAQFEEIQRQYSPDFFWLDAGWVGQGLQYLPLSVGSAAPFASAFEASTKRCWLHRTGRWSTARSTPSSCGSTATVAWSKTI